MRRKQEDKSSESGSTIIGSSLSFKGEITGEQDLTVQGQFEGTIDLKKNHVTIGRTGRIKADVYGRSITVEGEVQGSLFGEERIVLRQSGKVRGDMRAPGIGLEEGAKFKGNIAMESKDEKQPTLREFPLAQDRNVPTKKLVPIAADEPAALSRTGRRSPKTVSHMSPTLIPNHS